MKLRDAPIQRKLMNVILLTCSVVLLLMCCAYMTLEYFRFRDNLKNNLSTLGDIVASNSSGALAFDSPKDANEILSALKAEKHIVAACLYDNNGNVFAKYSADSQHVIFPSVINKMDYRFEGAYLVGFQPVMQQNSQLGTLYLQSDLKDLYEQLKHYAIVGLLLIAGSLVVAYVLSLLLQKTISEPIIALERTAKIISELRDYSVRAVKSGKDEVGELTDAFNQMLTEIETQNSQIISFNQKLEQNVSERTKELQQQKEFVETIINSSVDLIAVFNKDLQYLMLNKRANEYYEMSTEDLIGRYILDVFPQVENTAMMSDLKKALAGETVHSSKYKSTILNRYFENYYIPLKDKDDMVYGALTIGHDITNIVEANKNLETLNAELVKSNRDLEQFAYVASHDLQEPLRKIQTFSQLLEQNVHNESQQKKYREKIKQSSVRMQQLIQDVLNFSRIANAEEAFVDTDLNQVIRNLKTDFELVLREKEAVINCPKLPVIRGIPLQLSQLFANLLSNSLKYSVKKPVIDISMKSLTGDEIKKYPKLSNRASYINIQFADNGIGFEQEYSEQIFAIFQRLHGRQAYSGTGIGLALCKKIVENHNGIIFAHGEPDKGAVFNIILPS